MQPEQLEQIQALYVRHFQAFTQEMQTVVSTLSPEDEQQVNQAIKAALEGLGVTQKATGLGVLLGEQVAAIAPRVMTLVDTPEQRDRLRDVLVKHLHEQTREISEILLSSRH